MEAADGRAVVAHPEGRLADGHAAGLGHGLEVVGGARGEMDVRIEEVHGESIRLGMLR